MHALRYRLLFQRLATIMASAELARLLGVSSAIDMELCLGHSVASPLLIHPDKSFRVFGAPRQALLSYLVVVYQQVISG